MLFAGPSDLHGTGVFAGRAFRPGDSIVSNPVLVMPPDEWGALRETLLGGYVFAWGEDGPFAMALGLVSLCNHSYTPNAYYLQHLDEDRIELVAHHRIRRGEEVTINYNGDPDDDSPVWFLSS